MKLLAYITLFLSAGSAYACPLLNGDYVKTNSENRGTHLTMRTQVVGDLYRYSFGGGDTFWEANGAPHREEGGSITVTCDAATVTFKAALADGHRMEIRLTQISPRQFEVRGENELAAMNGVYTLP